MKKILSQTYRQIRILQAIGLYSYIKYFFTFKKNKEIPLLINNQEVLIRKGTPDIDVALSCFNGEFESLRFLLPQHYSGVIVDAGGYIGTAAIAISHIFPYAKILTIEPSSENLEILKKNVLNFKNIEVISGALVSGNKDKISLMNRGTGEWGYTTVAKPLDNNESQELHESNAFNLSTLGVNIEDIGILKLDIEGGELDLFLNDQESLTKIPNIIIELHDRIIDGCSDAFFRFSRDRIVIKDSGEKFLAIRR